MHRFFIPPEWIQDEQVKLPEEMARQIRQVLHLRPGDQITVLDDLGMEYQVKLDQVANKFVTGQITTRREAQGEPSTSITLYQCLTQRDKFEWILQKGAELGITDFVPVISNRSLVRNWTPEDARKVQRWERILKEAAEQSHRGRIPRLHPVLKFDAAVQSASGDHDLCLIPWEEERGQGLRPAFQSAKTKPAKIAVFIGPEGGFTPEEVTAARRAGAQAVSLGKRILRVETAAVAAVALVLYEVGEME